MLKRKTVGHSKGHQKMSKKGHKAQEKQKSTTSINNQQASTHHNRAQHNEASRPTMTAFEMEFPSLDNDSEEGVPLVMRGAWKQQLSPFRGRGESSITRILRTHPAWTRRLQVLSLLTAVFLLYSNVAPTGVSSNISTTYKEPEGLVHFTCPAVVETTAFAKDNEYTGFLKNILNSSAKDYVQNFRGMEFDGWTKSYDDMKAGMYHWKSTRYLDLKDGDHIYESACGIGLNLVMTLEILNEVKGLTNIVVYGNEYMKESVDVAHMLMTQGNNNILPAKGQMGEICQGDSSSLHFVPSNVFDLAFTGYITSMEDPLGLKITDRDNLAAAYHKICTGSLTKSARETRLQMQRTQEDWFAKWVTEMVRITKPGGSIIFESVTLPFCESEELGAGVSRLFWINGVHKYRWPVDTSTLFFEEDTIFQGRYHVSVRKWNNVASP
jgi:SAM-dependent methyltransferase